MWLFGDRINTHYHNDEGTCCEAAYYYTHPEVWPRYPSRWKTFWARLALRVDLKGRA